ncbi:Uncharacterized protein TCM_044628 [Theobroma cacao]|uniref:Uncharacterized protein n=1 Tax=Theobroma cacao TaxID=3641 RepID=A0A061FRG5_THECC|nr:Uncharacterized protein TCM_044628 [Theobroma cacao]
MAAIPAVSLALQHAPGVPVSGCQLRRNLVVTRTHNTSIMAAKSNPAVQYEAGVLVSTPCQLDRNWGSTKREKTIVAAFPAPVEYSTGVPVQTDVKLTNSSDANLKLDDVNFWEGSLEDDKVPKDIESSQELEFSHPADAKGSVGGLEYKFGENLKWIVAWSNSKNDSNKVYAQIVDQNSTVRWAQIKEALDKSGSTFDTGEQFGYSSSVEIHPTSATPKMTVTFANGKPPPPQ